MLALRRMCALNARGLGPALNCAEVIHAASATGSEAEPAARSAPSGHAFHCSGSCAGAILRAIWKKTKHHLAVAAVTEAGARLPTDLYTQVHAVLQQARQQAKRNVNQVMVQAYWQVGRLSWSTNKPGPNGRPMALRRCKP